MRLFAAGSNARGQLATGDDDDAHTFTACRFLVAGGDDDEGQHVTSVQGNLVKIAAGANHAIALLEDPVTLERSLWGAGDGSKGQLGPQFRNTGSHSVFKPIKLESPYRACSIEDVAAAWETTFVHARDPGQGRHYILSFGSNENGMLGIGSAAAIGVNMVDITSAMNLLPEDQVTVSHLVAGPRNAYALLKVTSHSDTNEAIPTTGLVGWGASRHGQLEITSTKSYTGTRSNYPIFVEKPTVIELPLGENVSSLAVGFQHAIVLASSGKLLGLGSGKKGQLECCSSPITSTINEAAITGIRTTWNSTFLLYEAKGEFIGCGSNTHGQLCQTSGDGRSSAIPLPGGEVQSWVCGSEHVLLLTNTIDGGQQLWGWGWNEHGNMGVGHTEDITAVNSLPIPNTSISPLVSTSTSASGRLPNITGIWAGCGTSWVAFEK